MARFDLLKTLGIKKSADKEFARLKANLQQEILRTIAKIDTGSIVSNAVDSLSKILSALVGGNMLAGFFVHSLLTSVDWVGLSKKPSADVIAILEDLSKEIEGWRL